MKHVPQALYRYRFHDASMTSDLVSHIDCILEKPYLSENLE
jgi:hypothetical protein